MSDGCGRLSTPLGDVVLAWCGDAVTMLDFADSGPRLEALLRKAKSPPPAADGVPESFATALSHYFAGDGDALSGLAVSPVGTPFQRRMWDALRRIPCGTTTTYGTLAARLGLPPTAARAIGRANALNPVSLVIPCHRLLGASGTLTGYAGGLHRKDWLLRHEGVAV